MTKFYYGKLPATEDPRDLEYSKYRGVAPLDIPVPNPPFGYGPLIQNWLMLGNGPDDTVYPGFPGAGNCAWAGPAHETMLINTAAGTPVTFTAKGVLSDYASTGYDINQTQPDGTNPTDQGSNVRDVLKYRMQTGIIDAAGKRHKIGAFLKLSLNPDEWLEALFLFGVVGIGMQVPDYAEQAFETGVWALQPGPLNIVGGHYVPLVYHPTVDWLDPVTWATQIHATLEFLRATVDEAWAILSPEFVNQASGKAPNGFDLAQLQADIANV